MKLLNLSNNYNKGPSGLFFINQLNIKIMNYDDWKLSNPIDDGYGYTVVSNCCGARMDEDQGLCYECKEHCEPMEDYEYAQNARDSYLEDRMDEERLGL